MKPCDELEAIQLPPDGSCTAAAAIPPGVIDRIVEVLDPEEIWLFGSRARETHSPDSDWDFMAVLPDTAPDEKLELAAVWGAMRDLRRLRVEVFPMRRRCFEEARGTPGELAEAVAREAVSSIDADARPWSLPRREVGSCQIQRLG